MGKKSLEFTIKQACNSLLLNKTVKLKHAEELSLFDANSLFRCSDIIIIDVSKPMEGKAYHLGFLTALDKNVIFICEYECSYKIPEVQRFFDKKIPFIVYNEKIDSFFIFELQSVMKKFLNSNPWNSL